MDNLNKRYRLGEFIFGVANSKKNRYIIYHKHIII